MKVEIKSRFSGSILFSLETDSLKLALAVVAAVKSGAYLFGADLSGAKIKFSKFPSIRLLSSINLGVLSAGLSTELMRRDAYAHPHPERFSEWADGGPCPYQKEERFWFFDLKKEHWKTGKPEMTDRDLITAICKKKGWEIETT